MSDAASKSGAARARSAFDQFTNRVFGNPIARGVAWSVFCVGLLFALLRFSVAMLPSLEGIADKWLEARFDTRIAGLDGAWHRMTPQLSLSRIDFPYGHLEDIRLEFDLLASLLAFSPRVSAIEVADAALRFPSDFDLLKQLSRPPNEPDFLSLIEPARFVAIRANIGRLDDPAELSLHWIAHKREAHRGELRVARVGVPLQEGLRLGYDLDPGMLSRAPEGAVWARGSLDIPRSMKSLLGVSGDLSVLGVDVRLVAGNLALSAQVRTDELEIGNFSSDRISARIHGAGKIGQLHGEFLEARVSRRDRVLDFTGTRFALNGDATWHFNLPDQEIESLTGFLAEAALEETPLVRWSQQFVPRGSLHTIRGRVGTQSPLVVAATLEDFSAQSWLGSPSMDSVNARMVFTLGAARLLIDTPGATLGLAKLFDTPVTFGRTTGEVRARFLPLYVGMHGIDIHAALPSGGALQVNFHYSAPVNPFERQITASVEAAGIGALDSLQFIPKTLPEGMRNWLRAGMKDGAIDHGQLTLAGYVRPQRPMKTMQIEMWMEFRDAIVMHHPLWPIANNVWGRAELAGGVLRCDIDRAEMLGESFHDVQVEMPMRGSSVRLVDAGEVDASFFAELANSSPLAELLPVRGLSFNARGPVRYDMEMRVPLVFELFAIELQSKAQLDKVDFGFQLGDLLDLGDLFVGLSGSLEYLYPDRIMSEGLSGEVFSRPAQFSTQSQKSGQDGFHRIEARVDSHLDATTLSRFLGDSFSAQGELAYAAHLVFDHQGAVPLNFALRSDLQGISLDIPAGLAKTSAESVPLTLDLRLKQGLAAGSADFSLSERVHGQLSWADLSEAEPDMRGKITFGEARKVAETTLAQENQFIVEGRISSLALQDLRQLATPSQSLSLPNIKIADLEIGSFDLGRYAIDDLILSGSWNAEEANLKVRGEQVQGTWQFLPGALSQVDFERIRLRPSESNEQPVVGDFLADLNFKSLPETDVKIASLEILDRDYGSWSFGLRHLEDGVQFSNLQAEARDLKILAPEGLTWRQSPDAGHQSRFNGALSSDDLASAMAQWGFAPSAEAERVEFTADLGWSDVPWKPRLQELEGEIDLVIRRGRFRDIDAPAGMKLLSLLDFNAFIRRLTLDFSDVFGEGVAFDEVRVRSQFADGWMHMIDPVKIDGNGSRFRIDGSINLETEELHNTMELTLKLSRSLPWFAAYLALFGNPVTGLGTFAIERLFRDPLERLSTAQYDVSGTLEDPVFTLSEVKPPQPLSSR